MIIIFDSDFDFMVPQYILHIILTRGELVFAVSALFFSLLGNTLARTNTVIARDLLFLYYSFREKNKNLSETFFTQIRLYLVLFPKTLNIF